MESDSKYRVRLFKGTAKTPACSKLESVLGITLQDSTEVSCRNCVRKVEAIEKKIKEVDDDFDV